MSHSFNGVFRLTNPRKHYDWGSLTALPAFLGEESPAPMPQAELWMSGYPAFSSAVEISGQIVPLFELIRSQPDAVLGRSATNRFNGVMPFLFKILASEKPLAIQTHPSLEQAISGYARETSQGMGSEDLARNYPDRNHKPEIICALSDFSLLVGFRGVDEMLRCLTPVETTFLREAVDYLERHPDPSGIEQLLRTLYTLEKPQISDLIHRLLAAPVGEDHEDTRGKLTRRIHRQYPDDVGVIVSVLLNHVELKPGEALYIPPGRIHAFLYGMGVELQANSDNVVRGGLTHKNVDWRELLVISELAPTVPQILRPRPVRGEEVYETPTTDFALSRISVHSRQDFRSSVARNIELIICTDGRVSVEDSSGYSTVDLGRGDSVVVPATVEKYLIRGKGTLYKATVP